MLQTPRTLVPTLLKRLLSHALAASLSVLFGSSLPAQAPPEPDKAAQQPAKPADTSAQSSPAAEVVTRDSAASFKVRVNVVLVRVVVRDEHGKIIDNLKKEDFQLFDNRKPQTISTFNLETPLPLRSGGNGHRSPRSRGEKDPPATSAFRSGSSPCFLTICTWQWKTP